MVKNSLQEILDLVYSPTKKSGISPTSKFNSNIVNTNYTDNPNELTALLKKEIVKQDDLIDEFTLMSKNIKKTNLEVQNELIQQNKMLKIIDKDVNFFKILFFSNNLLHIFLFKFFR